MFLRGRGWYDRHGGQHTKGPFLFVVLPKEWTKEDGTTTIHPPFTEARAFVRTVQLDQMGHFMTGYIHLGHRKIYIEGCYGADSLPASVDNDVWEVGIPIPKEIMEAWAKDSDSPYHDAGVEGPMLRRWADENLTALRRAGKNLQE